MTITEPIAIDEAQLRAKIDRQFNRVRSLLGCATDAELARHYGIRPQYISYWRNLKANRLDTVLAAILLADAPPTPDEIDIDTP